jgi:hypothetical protein
LNYGIYKYHPRLPFGKLYFLNSADFFLYPSNLAASPPLKDGLAGCEKTRFELK